MGNKQSLKQYSESTNFYNVELSIISPNIVDFKFYKNISIGDLFIYFKPKKQIKIHDCVFQFKKINNELLSTALVYPINIDFSNLHETRKNELFYYENKKDFENCSLIIRSDKDLNIIEVVCKTTTDFISSI